MIAARKPTLVVVGDVERSTAESLLDAIVPSLINAEDAVAKLRQLMAETGRELAKERGLKFIRPEQLRAEFGGRNGAQA